MACPVVLWCAVLTLTGCACRLLHGCSADVAAADDAGLTLLHLCARIEARVALVHYILQHSPNICPLDAAGRAPIHYACEHGHLAIVTALLASAPSSACLPDAALWTPLHFAALGAWPMHESHSEVTSLLLLSPVVDVNAREGQGLTPLHLCTDTPAARLLVKAGADIRVRDVSGRMPVHYASHENSIMLLQQGSPVDPRDKSALSVCRAVRRHESEDEWPPADHLLALRCAVPPPQFRTHALPHLHGGRQGRVSGAAPRACGGVLLSTQRSSPAAARVLVCVSYLVVHGADINALDDEGKTPLDWAIEVDRLDVAESAQRAHSTTAHVSALRHTSSCLLTSSRACL